MRNYYSRLTAFLMTVLLTVNVAFAQSPPPQPTMDQFMGTNVFINDPVDMIADVSGVVREYHPWSFSVPDTDGAPAEGYTSDNIEYSFNRWSGFWNFDEFYSDLQFNNVEAVPCLWEPAPWMSGGEFDAPV